MQAVVFLVASVCTLSLAILKAEELQVKGQQVSQQSTTTTTMAPSQNSNSQMSSEGSSQSSNIPDQQMQPGMNPADSQISTQGQQTTMPDGSQGSQQGSQGSPSQAQTPPMNQQGSRSYH